MYGNAYVNGKFKTRCYQLAPRDKTLAKYQDKLVIQEVL